jgi:hypothetical protein
VSSLDLYAFYSINSDPLKLLREERSLSFFS